MYQERIRLMAALVLSFCIIEFLIFGGLGIAVPIVVAIFYGLVLWQAKGSLKEKLQSKLFIPIMLVAACFGLFDNMLLKQLNLILLLVLMVLHMGEVFHINPHKCYTMDWFLHIFSMMIIMPFEEVGGALKAAKEEGEQNSGKRAEVVKKVVIGILISLPIIGLAGALLMQADAAFEGVVDLVLGYIHIDVFYIISRMITVALLFVPCAGFFYGLQKPRVLLATEECEEKIRWKIDFTIGMTVATLTSLLYSVYLLSQLGYFISAFRGILPSDFTYAEYARRGFFEMLPIAFLNIGLIACLNMLVAGKDDIKKAKWLRNYSCFFIGFTLFIIITALSKMVLYMGNYGLTIKRVYVTWFLILCLVILVLIGISLFKKKFNLLKNLFITFMCLYIGLNYINVDYCIAYYNASMYGTTQAELESSFEELSLSAVGPYIGIQDREGEGCIPQYKWNIERYSNWENWNLARYQATQLLANEK